MSGWWVLICGCACAMGAMILLGLVAHQVKRIEIAMSIFERSQERAAKRRKKARVRDAARLAQEAAEGSEGASTGDAPVMLRRASA